MSHVLRITILGNYLGIDIAVNPVSWAINQGKIGQINRNLTLIDWAKTDGTKIKFLACKNGFNFVFITFTTSSVVLSDWSCSETSTMACVGTTRSRVGYAFYNTSKYDGLGGSIVRKVQNIIC